MQIKITMIMLELSAMLVISTVSICGSPSRVIIHENILADVMMINRGPQASAVSLHVSHSPFKVTFL